MVYLSHRWRRAATAVSVAAITAVAGAAAASAATRSAPAVSGTEHIQVMAAATSGPATAIAYGAFAAAGRAHFGGGKVGKLALPGGTIVLTHTAGKGSEHFNPATCLSTIRQPGTFRIARGTGRYAGISGHGTYELSLLILGTRVHGACSSAKPPAGQQELLQLTGHVRL
jgi:hypothetical protein